MNTPKRAILHHSYTPDYTQENPAFDVYGAADIDNWHRNRKPTPFKMIGYHDVIRRTGVWEKGRPIEMFGAHTKGQNVHTVGICLIGTRDFTADQIDTLIEVAFHYNVEYGITADDWYMHNQFAVKKAFCPGFGVELLRALLRAEGL